MKQEKISVKILPDTRRTKTGEQFPLKLRVTYKGERKYYHSGYDASEKEWQLINDIDAKGNLRKIKNTLAEIEQEAVRCAEAIIPFSFTKFEFKFFQQPNQYLDLDSAFQSYIIDLRKNDQDSSADNYVSANNSFKWFRKNLKLQDMTKDLLNDYERWMIKEGKSMTTIGIYTRCLRAVFNVAKENGVVKPEDYPFGRRRYVVPTGRNVKKALRIEQVKQIFDYPVIPGTALAKAKDIWIFTYLCNGMNMMDIAQLKWCDLQPTCIHFVREKTKRSTKGNPIIITVARNNYIDEIIRKWGIKGNSDDYIFGVITDNDDSKIKRAKIKQFTQVNNGWTKKIGNALEFDRPLTTYVARHSFATILLRSGAPMKLASQSLGHASITTTEKYFAGFELTAQAEFAKALINF